MYKSDVGSSEAENRDEIIQVLQKFQQGYVKRDLNEVDHFMGEIFVLDEDLLVIGTSAINVDSDEWCEGTEKVRTLIEDDWKYWGDLVINIKEARISVECDSACVSIEGVVSEIMKQENYYDFRLELIKKTLEKKDISSKTRLIEIIQGISDTLYEVEKGEKYDWPVRISGNMVKRNNKWLFNQLHFSYPITFYPPVRNINN